MLTTRIKIDPILVSPTGILTGPGTIVLNITKQSYALPKPPKLETHSSSNNQSTAENHTHKPALSQSIQSTKIPSTVSTNMVSQNNPANPSSMKSTSVAT